MRDFGVACLIIGLALCMFGLGGLTASAQVPQPTVVVIPDPDAPGQTIYIREVVVGEMRCAVLISGVERRSAISCGVRR